MEPGRAALALGALLLALLLGAWLARVAAVLAGREDAVVPPRRQVALVTVLLAAGLVGAALLGGARPATLALGWLAAAGVVLAVVDLRTHRLPDRVTLPAYGVCAAALLADAAVLGTWAALARAVLAGAAAFAVAACVAALSPTGLGFGDVKLLGLLGLVLGWFGWGTLLAGILGGLLTGALVSAVLVLSGRAGWRTPVAFGPPLLAGSVLALLLGAAPPG